MTSRVEEIIDLFDEFFIIDPHAEADQQMTAEPDAAQPPVVAGPEPDHAAQPEIASPPPKPSTPLHYSGANKKHIAVIYNDKNNDSRENVEMLSNLLTKALRLSMDDVAIVRLSKNPGRDLGSIFEELHAEKALVWGIPGTTEDLKGSKVHEQVLIGKTRALINDEVHQYHHNPAYKARLWEAIQQLFS